MTIEFHTPYNKVSDELVNSIRNDVLKLSHINKHITRAEIELKEDQHILLGKNKVCEIRLSVYGGDLFVRRTAEDFEKSSKETIKELKRLVRQQEKKQNEPPDTLVSTIRI